MRPSHDLIASVALDFYKSLPKTGKPQPHEFTVYAAFLLSTPQLDKKVDGPRACDPGTSSRLHVVAAATGTKCLPGSQRSLKGDLLNDCHAEALARRALLLWLYREAELTLKQLHDASSELTLKQLHNAYSSSQHQATNCFIQQSTSSPDNMSNPHVPTNPNQCSQNPPSSTACEQPGTTSLHTSSLHTSNLHTSSAQSTEAEAERPKSAQTRLMEDPDQSALKSTPFTPGSLLVFDSRTGQLQLPPDVQLHLYISQPPCGDACIVNTGVGGLPGEVQCTSMVQQPKQQPQNETCMSQSRDICAHDPAGILSQSRDICAHDPAGILSQSRDICAHDPAGILVPLLQPTPETIRFRTGAKALKLDPTALESQLIQSQVPAKQQIFKQGIGRKTNIYDDTEAEEASFLVPGSTDVEAGAQVQGVARRKPGKGAPTLSMSCSDKLAKWACLGLQGSLLSSLFVSPVLLSSLTVSALPEVYGAGAGVLSAANLSLQRGVSSRMNDALKSCTSQYLNHNSTLDCSLVAPVDAASGLLPSSVRKVGSGASITWAASAGVTGSSHASKNPKAITKPSIGNLEVLAAGDGCKSGVSKAARASPRHWPALCRAALFERFCSLVDLLVIACQPRQVKVLRHLMDRVAMEARTAESLSGEAASHAPAAASEAAGVKCMERCGGEVEGNEEHSHLTQKEEVGICSLEVWRKMYRDVKDVCGGVSGYEEAWKELRFQPSPLATWINKPRSLDMWTGEAVRMGSSSLAARRAQNK
ncbi:hypothetical protein CEUSTIGMA_g5070.t1 [Chlamydomonas eustigma]|uniref:tRNA-specific adenosine deaminase 1 n=1 Tax=Chlamydomonas eustigma TaxID=1157962 RepID=A0A250X3H8_9CHLO|nr:hypothetical protein CEUSTIGMA_g5070.t1 [Chlamydomonas eustigma]|eukprot:GAX77627.1 hypothetical protein CEUSTIGMA_g5070.t1 [Chlamydomonas eustigma]